MLYAGNDINEEPDAVIPHVRICMGAARATGRSTMTLKSDETMIPNTKISHTILEFGKSIILQLPDDHSKEEFEAAISIVIVAWNAVVMDAWNKTDKFERELMERLEEGPKQAKIEVKRLIKRKKTKFSTDLRAVGNHWVREQEGEYIFGCEARGNVENFPAEKTKH